ncbi:hypothetical protein CEXT_812611 [Caerostris extrusa]|uniref:Uncharacterized protein n=1 Tax=Caerostris extrusa TaxID=172846 RepID=A0AAV4N534_CAEEX|nr:hypothetical protein CEXT_812611 [Caerostris extrusa]
MGFLKKIVFFLNLSAQCLVHFQALRKAQSKSIPYPCKVENFEAEELEIDGKSRQYFLFFVRAKSEAPSGYLYLYLSISTCTNGTRQSLSHKKDHNL